MIDSILAIKKIDYLLGPYLLKFFSQLRSDRQGVRNPNSPNKILVVRPGGIGDAALLLPSLKTLKKIYSSAEIEVLCEPRNIGVFSGSPLVSRIYSYRSLGDLAKLSRNEFEIVFDTEQSHFLSAVLVSKFRHSLKVGFATNGREKVYDIGVPYRQNRYEMYSFFELFKSVVNGWPKELEWEPPYFSASPEEESRVFERLGLTDRLIIAIFPGASIKERHWPNEKWVEVIENLWERGFNPVVIGGQDELTISSQIANATKCKVLNLCGRLSLKETSVLLTHARLLISTDSGILHLGVLCDTPTVSLFGPGIAKKWGPRGDKHIVINKEIECSPCTLFGHTPPCPRGALCMKLITSEDVLEASISLLEK